MSGFRKAVIIPPTFQVQIQLINNLCHAFTTVAVGQFPDSCLEALNCLLVNPDLCLTTHTDKGKPKKFAQPWSADSTFILINLKFKLICYEFGNAIHNTNSSFPAFKINHKVISVPDKIKFSLFQLLIQFIKNYIGK